MAIRPTGQPGRWTAVVDGQRLRELRRQQALSQVELARLAGVSAHTVSKLERQPASCCRSRTLARLAAALGESPSAIDGQHGSALGLTPRNPSSCEDFLHCHQGRACGAPAVRPAGPDRPQ